MEGRRKPEGIDLPPTLAGLDDLALDMRLAWSHRGDRIWTRISSDWSISRNSWAALRAVSAAQLEELGRDEEFCRAVHDLLEYREQRISGPVWFTHERAPGSLKSVAYFSMEFGLSEALPIYAGGLGVLAGDHLKAASDLGVPVVGVGLMYQQGYFRQFLDTHGYQHELYPFNDPSDMPVQRVRDRSGGWVRVPLEFPGRLVYLRAWVADVGGRPLYLLDSNDPANTPVDRGITARLYEADRDVRWQQEMVLGIGGWRLLRMLGLDPDVCHLNEGHAALAVLERTRSIVQEQNVSFGAAFAAVRAGTVFTTHTPVAAAFDRFEPALVARYLRRQAADLQIGIDDLLALGRASRRADDEMFNMAFLAIRGSGRINGVSRLHGETSRALFQGLFPRWPVAEVPVGHVTNGVHTPSWDSRPADALWDDAGTGEYDTGRVAQADIWSMRTECRARLVEWIREQVARHLTAAGASPDRIDEAKHILDPHALTLGFARRFTGYKRPALLLHDPERFERLITNAERPVQIVVAGKAHPADDVGKAMIRQWVEFAQRAHLRSRIVFIPDYDLLVAEQLVQGVDVWINNPRRPWEACGTSGMKVLVNGGINVSELDGWWAEAFQPGVGWALGDGQEHDEDPEWDAVEAESLYGILESEVVPMFYDRGADGIPSAWVERMRESMMTLTQRFSARRMLCEYTDAYYEPAAATYRARVGDRCHTGFDVHRWERMIADYWGDIAFGQLHVDETPSTHAFRVLVTIGSISPDWVAVELYAAGLEGGAPERIPMQRGEEVVRGTFSYLATVSNRRPASDYTPRVVPYHPDTAVPLEANQILWQR